MRMNDLAAHTRARYTRRSASAAATPVVTAPARAAAPRASSLARGYSRRIGFEGGQNPLIRSLSRLRGFTNRFRVEYEPVNIDDLAKFDAGTSVTSASLREAGIVKSARMPVKILGRGEISVALTVEAERFSATARQKIEAAGGTVKELNPAPVKEAKTSEAAPKAPADSAEAEEESEA